MNKPTKKGKKAAEKALLDAGDRLIASLTDDHEDCRLCDSPCDGGHEVDAPCGELLGALRRARVQGVGR